METYIAINTQHPKLFVVHNVCGKISHHAKLSFRIVMLAHGLVDWFLQPFPAESTVKAVG